MNPVVCIHLSLIVRPGGDVEAMVWMHGRLGMRIISLQPIDEFARELE